MVFKKKFVPNLKVNARAKASIHKWHKDYQPMLQPVSLAKGKELGKHMLSELCGFSRKAYFVQKNIDIDEKEFVTIKEAIDNGYRKGDSIEGMIDNIVYKGGRIGLDPYDKPSRRILSVHRDDDEDPGYDVVW